MTKLRNLNYYQIDTKILMDILKKKFDTSATLRESGTEIVLQGTFLDQVKDYLMFELKLKEDEIEEIDKISGRKKKETFKI